MRYTESRRRSQGLTPGPHKNLQVLAEIGHVRGRSRPVERPGLRLGRRKARWNKAGCWPRWTPWVPTTPPGPPVHQYDPKATSPHR